MDACGPFERKATLAVAVSGGADSMALALVAHDWARKRGASIVALTVDHGLRAESSREAHTVKVRLAEHGIAHRTLRWRDRKPRANLQALARAARYRLLESWCSKAGILHLLLAHHLEDQAETFLLRLGRGSGVDGLAAMAPVTELEGARVLRPLLGVPKDRLRATLRARNQPWTDDPTNEDAHHARVRVRALLPALGQEGLGPARLAATAAHLGRARQALEESTVHVFARAVTLAPAGYALLDREEMLGAPAEVGLRSLARLLQSIGQGAYPPRFERLERLYREIAAGLPAARTLAGCRVLRRHARMDKALLICREPGDVAPDLALARGGSGSWDGRFLISVARNLPGARGTVHVGALGPAGWAELVALAPQSRNCPVPGPVRPSLPALRDLDGLLAVPHLWYGRGGIRTGTVYVRHLAFRPIRPLATGRVTVA